MSGVAPLQMGEFIHACAQPPRLLGAVWLIAADLLRTLPASGRSQDRRPFLIVQQRVDVIHEGMFWRNFSVTEFNVVSTAASLARERLAMMSSASFSAALARRAMLMAWLLAALRGGGARSGSVGQRGALVRSQRAGKPKCHHAKSTKSRSSVSLLSLPISVLPVLL